MHERSKEQVLNQLIYLFKQDYPSITKDIVTYVYGGTNKVLGKYEDGRVILYDAFNSSIRRMPNSSDDMSEEDLKREFGYRVLDIMTYKGITQKELSIRTGISEPQLSQYMTGKVMPSFYKADKIAKALDCSLGDLTYED